MIIFVGLLVFLAHFFVVAFERTRVPDVLYLILIGLVIGPVLGIARPDDFGKVGPIFTTVALVIILFEAGLDLKLETLKTSLGGMALITVLSYFVALLLLSSAVFALTRLDALSSLFVGAVLAGPAPAVIIPLSRHLKLTDRTRTLFTLESSVGEALCIVIALAFLELMRLGDIRVGRLIGTLLSSFIFAVIVGAIGGYVWSILLNRMRELRYAIFTTPAFVFILYGIAEFLGFSGPIAALTCGILMGNAPFIRIPKRLRVTDLKPIQHNETEKQFFAEIVFLVKTFFFVYLGLSFRFSDLRAIGVAFLLSLVLLIARLIATQYSLDRSSTPRSDASLAAVMIPKGTAAAVLAALPLQMSFAGGALIQNSVYGVIVLSILLTAILIPLIEKTPVGKLYGYLLPMYKIRPPEVEKSGKA